MRSNHKILQVIYSDKSKTYVIILPWHNTYKLVTKTDLVVNDSNEDRDENDEATGNDVGTVPVVFSKPILHGGQVLFIPSQRSCNVLSDGGDGS